jgi:hypothetical protein
MIRQMSVAGSFYPARAIELERYFTHFNEIYGENFTLPNINSKAIVVPHAGYIYSGYTANIAYRILQKSNVKNLVVIGPSHKVAFEGASLCNFENYLTPFNEIKNAKELMQNLKSNFSFKCLKEVHLEHSTEVQFPFIKHYLPDVNIVEIVYGRENPQNISRIIDYILKQEDCGVVISTDLSHFYTLSQANKFDSICLKAIENLDLNMLYKGCEACGTIGLEAMIISANKLNLKSEVLDYRTSADTSGDKDRVVGYVSACFY